MDFRTAVSSGGIAACMPASKAAARVTSSSFVTPL